MSDRPVYHVTTEPWELGLVVNVKDVGITQTHQDFPNDTVESMARDLVATMCEVSPKSFDLVIDGIELEVLHERRIFVVQPGEQQPDTKDAHGNTVRPTLVALMFTWSAPALRATEDSLNGEVEVEISGQKVDKGKLSPYPYTARLQWRDHEEWPEWITDLVDRFCPVGWVE